MSVALHPDRLLPTTQPERDIARSLYEEVAELPLVCPHTHVDPALFATDQAFPDPTALLITPDHYLLRMLYSQGVGLEELGRLPRSGEPAPAADPRAVWQRFWDHWHLFRGTPSRMWIEHQLRAVFAIKTELGADTADVVYDELAERLASPEFRPRALFERFGIEVLATTDDAAGELAHHQALGDGQWNGRVIPTFRPDDVVDPSKPGWRQALKRLAMLTGEDVGTYEGYLAALRARRAAFAGLGATATDHGEETAQTAWLPDGEAARIYRDALSSPLDGETAGKFRAHMLMESACMSAEDGLVMQLHAGSVRNHHRGLYERFGPDVGADIPTRTDFVHGLAPLLNELGTHPRFRLVVFTLDESTYSRELAPLAGHYPALRLGPPWWFFDSPAGMRRHREAVVETAGFSNLAGFNDDARGFTSIPVRHDMARRVDSGYLARLVAEHQLGMDEARDVARLLAYDLVRDTYRLP